MPSRYEQWMYDWETRLTSVDNNRVVRPLEWGVEWARALAVPQWLRARVCPGGRGFREFLREYNHRIVAIERRVLFLQGSYGLSA